MNILKALLHSIFKKNSNINTKQIEKSHQTYLYTLCLFSVMIYIDVVFHVKNIIRMHNYMYLVIKLKIYKF